jgi:hypothetical protein
MTSHWLCSPNFTSKMSFPYKFDSKEDNARLQAGFGRIPFSLRGLWDWERPKRSACILNFRHFRHSQRYSDFSSSNIYICNLMFLAVTVNWSKNARTLGQKTAIVKHVCRICSLVKSSGSFWRRKRKREQPNTTSSASAHTLLVDSRLLVRVSTVPSATPTFDLHQPIQS